MTGIIIACDVNLEKFEELVKQTADIDKITGYKPGFALGLTHGLPKVVQVARKYTDKPIIYDHQKAGTDIPDTGKLFAQTMRHAGVDAAILFPMAGPSTLKAWVLALREEDVKVIVGGIMTHANYTKEEGGFIDNPYGMYELAASLGVKDFVVPGTKPDVIKKVKAIVEAHGVSPTFYAPGFIAQGGKIAEAAKILGDSWHAIVGRGIYEATDIRKAALEHTREL